jgi:adenine deaminase
VDSSGNVRYETLRLATNTLLIDEGGTVVRIEGNLTKAQALQIAGSLG